MTKNQAFFLLTFFGKCAIICVMSPMLVLDTREKRRDDFVFSGYGNEKTSPAQGNDYATF